MSGWQNMIIHFVESTSNKTVLTVIEKVLLTTCNGGYVMCQVGKICKHILLNRHLRNCFNSIYESLINNIKIKVYRVSIWIIYV